MKIALIGYGKMGKMIESLVKENGTHEIGLIISSQNNLHANIDRLKLCDAVIDFSVTDAVIYNAKIALDSGKPFIIGTTGWYDNLTELQNICKQKNGSVVYGSNFSTGVNLFFALNDFLANLMKTGKNYSASIEETHHTQKKDAPSGTGITLANSIIEKRKWLNNWKLKSDSSVNEHELSITSNRIGDVIGDHKVIYKSAHDEISITHSAFDRKGFAEGAIVAAEWALNKKGFYSFREVVSEMIAEVE